MAKILPLRRLIIVPGHGVYLGTSKGHSKNPSFWQAAFPEECRQYVEHIAVGIQQAAAHPDAVLIFSGGCTQPATPLSEAQGYFHIVQQQHWFGFPEVQQRLAIEEYARDSFENISFSLLLFWQRTKFLPQQVTVCGWGFKAERYRFHAQTLGFPLQKFQYREVNNPLGDRSDAQSLWGIALHGELQALALFRKYPFGDQGELLLKRQQRDPFQRGSPYDDSLQRFFPLTKEKKLIS